MKPNIEALIVELNACRDYHAKQQEKFRLLVEGVLAIPALENIEYPLSYHWDGDSFDFDYTTHEQTIEIIKTLGGKWTKEYSGAYIDYKAIISGVTFRVFHSEPPPNCKIVEEVVEVPATITPASTKTVRRLQCVDPV